MAVVVGLNFFLGSCVAYKLHNCAPLQTFFAGTRNYKKLLFGTLSLMAISLFAISGDIHYAKSTAQTRWRHGHMEEALFVGNTDEVVATVSLFCIFMVIYSVGVRHPVAVLEERLVGQRTSGKGTLIYKAINTTTNWLVVSLLIHLFLFNWRHIGLGWILVFFATACLLSIIYVAVFIPEDLATDGDEEEDANNNIAQGGNNVEMVTLA